MKSLSFRRNSTGAFTLVELLVVIAIIAILAGVVIGGVSSALRFAKRTKASSTAVQLQTAIQSYYTEYNVYPTADAVAKDDYYDAAVVGNWPNLMYALCGNINPYNGVAQVGTITSNSRSISYLTPTRSDIDNTGTLVNPFGTSAKTPYFYLAIDTDYDGLLGQTGDATGKLVDFSGAITAIPLTRAITQGVAVWCSCDQPLAGQANSRSNFWSHTY